MRFGLVLFAISIAVGLSGCSYGNGDTSASRAAREVFQDYLDGDYGKAWDSLHPAHQAIVARDTCINCQSTTQGLPWNKVQVDREHDEIWDAPEVGQITTRTVELRLIGDKDITQGSLHLVKVDGQWRWFLDADAVRAFKEGKCA